VKAKVPRLAELIDARVTSFCPLQVGDYGFIVTDNGVMIGKSTHKFFLSLLFTKKCLVVVAFSSKSGGKNGKHCDITESSTIAAVSNIAVQLFQYRGRAREFRLVTDATLLFRTKQYLLIPSIQFLCLLDTNFPSDQALPYIEVKSDMDMEHFKALKEGKNELISALKLSRKRGGV
jgi:hypothetical protein